MTKSPKTMTAMTDPPRVGEFYAVEPGDPYEPGPAFFSPDLAGLQGAIRGAVRWSYGKDGRPQELSVTRGRVTTVFRVFEHGQESWRREPGPRPEPLSAPASLPPRTPRKRARPSLRPHFGEDPDSPSGADLGHKLVSAPLRVVR